MVVSAGFLEITFMGVGGGAGVGVIALATVVTTDDTALFAFVIRLPRDNAML